jgi:beta-lactamase superfamily II metal-dependent hydrolase
MPKLPPVRVDTYADLKNLLDKEHMKLAGSLSEQINSLSEAIRSLRGAYAFLSDSNSRPTGSLFPYTKRTAAVAVDDVLKVLNPNLAALKALREKQRNFANRMVVSNDSGEYAGNGKLYVQFVNIGMGDCTLITTPKGVNIMVDCGSFALEDVTSVIPNYDPKTVGSPEEIIGNAVRSKTFLNGSGEIDILVLTHPDKDHHNKLEKVLKDTIGGSVSVKVVYFGGVTGASLIGGDELAAYYPSNGYITEIAGKTNAELRRVDLQFNGSEAIVKKMINGVDITNTSGTANQIGMEYIDPATGEMVLYYEDGNSDFRLSALASNVTGYWLKNKVFVGNDAYLKGADEMKLNGEVPNKRCLVVMVRCFKQNILVTGDATVVTEKFMLRFFKDSLKTVQTLRMGHHGSPTSSCQDFVNALTAMNLAVASTSGQDTVIHHLPKRRIMDLYNLKVPDGVAAHDIWAFEKETDSKAQNYFPGMTRKLFATGSNDTVSMSFPKPT